MSNFGHLTTNGQIELLSLHPGVYAPLWRCCTEWEVECHACIAVRQNFFRQSVRIPDTVPLRRNFVLFLVPTGTPENLHWVIHVSWQFGLYLTHGQPVLGFCCFRSDYCISYCYIFFKVDFFYICLCSLRDSISYI